MMSNEWQVIHWIKSEILSRRTKVLFLFYLQLLQIFFLTRERLKVMISLFDLIFSVINITVISHQTVCLSVWKFNIVMLFLQRLFMSHASFRTAQMPTRANLFLDILTPTPWWSKMSMCLSRWVIFILLTSMTLIIIFFLWCCADIFNYYINI